MAFKCIERGLASKNLFRQIVAAVLKRWWLPLIFVALLVLIILLPSPFYSAIEWKEDIACPFLGKIVAFFRGHPYRCEILKVGTLFLCASFAFGTVISACNALTDVFSLRREEKRITNCQIAILSAIGLWILIAVFILKVYDDQTSKIIFALIGVVLTWIFQDRVIGVVTFIHLRSHGLLKIDDWIKVPKLDVNGEIKKVTLTTITVSNWDTTTSTIPISALQSNPFTNLQKMQEGKTYGRRMLQQFTIDSGWIHPIDEKDVKFLKSGKHPIMNYLPEEEVNVGVLNIHLYRLYLYHWLMEDSHISQQPRLIVRWKEQKDSGMVLEVYTFITESNFSAFEWQQSRIMEHIIESMAWFGLRVYQSPSAYDASNSNIYMAKAPANYKIENK